MRILHADPCAPPGPIVRVINMKPDHNSEEVLNTATMPNSISYYHLGHTVIKYFLTEFKYCFKNR
jgi:hypothetical protein